MGTTKSSLNSEGSSRKQKRKENKSSARLASPAVPPNGKPAETQGANGNTSSPRKPPLLWSPTKDRRGRSDGGGGGGSGRLSLFRKTPPKHRPGSSSEDRASSLPGGATSPAEPAPAEESGIGAKQASRRPVSGTPAACGFLPRVDTNSASVDATSRSCVMSPPATRPASRESGRPGTGDSTSSRTGRVSMRIIRQPSTYGELHEMVAQQKLGGGVIRGLVGLQNLGNTCFMNSALQCLLNCEALTDYFLGFDWKNEINRANFLGHKGLMATAFGALANEMWRSDKAFIRPSDFKSQVGDSMPLFAGYEQQDVQEFLAFMLDAVHEDLNRVPNADRKYVEAKEAKEGEPEEMVAMQAWKGYLERNRSIIVDLFQGQLRSALQCSVCGHRSVTFDPFMYLTVPLPDDSCAAFGGGGRGGGGGGREGGGAGCGTEGGGRRRPRQESEGVSLEACIRRFCEVETLEGDNAWYCSKCKKHQPATKKLDLWKVPPVLIVHLKRFAGSSKITSLVSFPLEGLDLSEVVKSPQKEPPDYDLIATANHQGSVHGGHYTATAKNRVSGDWNLFNDERVHGLEPNEVQSASAYVLFFTKMSTVEESVDDEDEYRGDDHHHHNVRSTQEQRYHSHLHQPRPPDGFSANETVAAVSPIFACSADSRLVGEQASGASSPAAFSKGRRATAGDAKPSSPKREAAVVRRQSVSKPHNWPHRVDGFEPSFKPAFQPPVLADLPLPESVQAMEISVSDDAVDGSGDGSGAPGGNALTRSMAEQGFGKPRPGDNPQGTTLPVLPGATSDPSAGEGESSARAHGDAARGHRNLRGGRGSDGPYGSRPS